MPYTLNGVGTSYYGRRDLSVVQGTCSACGRLTNLSSYETTECFCVVFIPLIPLRKYRILNDCASCRRHHRVPLAEFKNQLENEIAPLRRAVERSPSDPDARVRLIETLMGYQMYVQAEAAAREAVNAHPRHAWINRLMGHLLAVRNDLAGATQFYRQAAAEAPRDAEIRFALGRNLLARGENAEAVRELGEAWRLAPDNSQALYLMAEALFAEKRWGEALDAYQQIGLRHPDMAKDRDLLRRMKECKEALGFPITDAERKAARRWWPFGSSRKRVRTAKPQTDFKRLAPGLGFLLLVGGIVAGVTAVWKQRHDDLWLDNSLAQPLNVTLDTESFSLPAGPPVRKTVPPGDHSIVIKDAKGQEIERYTARVPKLDLFDALMKDRFFVYNVAAARVYAREEIGYAESAENQTYRRTLVAFERFFEQDGVDFIFKAAPETIQVDSHSTVTKKTAFNVTELDANGVAVAWFGEGKVDEAVGALRRALAAQPCSAMVRGNLLQALSSSGRAKEAADEARKWIFECPDSGVEAHRAYQEAQLAVGKRADLLAEYKARLDAQPGSGTNHYLYARLLHDPAQSTPHYQEALRLDPGLWWGRVGLAYDLMAQERNSEAAENLEQVLRTPGHDESVATMYAMASIGAGSTDHASEVLDSLTSPAKGQAGSLYVWQARWLLQLARGDFGGAAQRLQELSQAGDQDLEWNYRTQLLRLQGDDAGLKKAIAEGRLQPGKAGVAGTFRQERALAAGNWSEAVAALEDLKPEDVSPADRLLAAWALQMSGDREKAGQRLAALEAELASNAQDPEGAAFLAMTRHLEGRERADAVLDAARRAGFTLLPQAYFVLAAAREAAGDAPGARPLYEKSRRTALDFGVPYAAAAARAKEAPASGS